MSSKTAQETLTRLLSIYRNEPVKFFRDVLRVTLDEQQLDLVNRATKTHSRVMVKSARGTGKTFIISGLTLYFLICFKDVNIRVLSPNEQQLKTVFMREIRKHLVNMEPMFRNFYEIRALSIFNKFDSLNEAHCVTASVERPENVSGMHSDKQVYMLDEASAIPDSIYSTVIGSLGTALESHVIGTSNPNRGSGCFYTDLFEKRPEAWDLLTFTAQKCPRISKAFIDEMEDIYGVDGDEYRVSVLGEFPRADGSTFIPASLIEDASQRLVDMRVVQGHPIICGVDVARSLSGDSTVFVFRQGQKLLDIVSFKTADTMEVVARLSDAFAKYKPTVIYGDATGVGGPVMDRCRQMGLPVVDVMVGSKSSDPLQYANLRTQLWGEMRTWLADAAIPDHYDLKRGLREMTWGYTGKMAMQLTSKKNLKSKGIGSPDHADALSLTFYDSIHSVRRRNTFARPIKKRNIVWA